MTADVPMRLGHVTPPLVTPPSLGVIINSCLSHISMRCDLCLTHVRHVRAEQTYQCIHCVFRVLKSIWPDTMTYFLMKVHLIQHHPLITILESKKIIDRTPQQRIANHVQKRLFPGRRPIQIFHQQLFQKPQPIQARNL